MSDFLYLICGIVGLIVVTYSIRFFINKNINKGQSGGTSQTGNNNTQYNISLGERNNEKQE